MRITECYVRGFGKIKQQGFSFKPGLNCIYSPNGNGKTTLSYFITAMLYGITDTRRQKLDENERRRFTPWDGGEFGGSLTFLHNGKAYRIERSFGAKASEDSLAIYDAKIGTAIDFGSVAPGEAIFGIDRSGFERSVFLSEKSLCDNLTGGGISAKLSNLSGVDGDMSEVDAALARLEEKRRFYYKKGGGGEIGDIRRMANDYDSRLYALDEKAREYDRRKEKIERANEHLSLLEEKRQSLRRAISARGDEGVSRKPRKTAAIMLVIGILSALGGIMLGSLLSPYLYLVCAAGAVLTVISSILLAKRTPKKLNIEETMSAIDALDDDIARLGKEIAIWEAECLTIATELRGREELSKRLRELRQAEKSHEDALRIIQLTSQLIRMAHSSMTEKYLGDVKRNFDVFSSHISGENAEFTLDTDFTLKRIEKGLTHEKDAYSRGTKDLYTLALRLSVAKVLYGSGEPSLIILDDPLIAMDDDTIKRGGELLRHISTDTQIIYFTCHKSRLV